MGTFGDIPVPADYDADGRDDLAVWRPSTSEWWIRYWNGKTKRLRWGLPGDVPYPGYYACGTSRAKIAVWRPTTGVWWVRDPGVVGNPGVGETCKTRWGLAGDVPILLFFPNDFCGNDRQYRSTISVWRPSTAEFWIHGGFGGGLGVVEPAGSGPPRVGDRWLRLGVWFEWDGVEWRRLG